VNGFHQNSPMLACWLAIEARSGSTPGAPAQAAPERNVNFSQEAHNRARRLGEFGSFQFVDIFPCAERSKESGASARNPSNADPGACSILTSPGIGNSPSTGDIEDASSRGKARGLKADRARFDAVKRAAPYGAAVDRRARPYPVSGPPGPQDASPSEWPAVPLGRRRS
jgi:hypothetical protein